MIFYKFIFQAACKEKTMKKLLLISALLFISAHIQAACTITTNSIANIQLGQTLADVKRQLSCAMFT